MENTEKKFRNFSPKDSKQNPPKNFFVKKKNSISLFLDFSGKLSDLTNLLDRFAKKSNKSV